MGRLAVDLEQLKTANAAIKAVQVLYSGVPGGRPESDADQLRALAQMLDQIDDVMDKALGRDVTNGRDIQVDLRRIADRLGIDP